MSYKILLILLFPFSLYAFDKDLKIENDQLPLEFVHLFDSMKATLNTPKDQIKFVGLLQDLSENLGQLEKDQIFMLMKSEVIKNVLEHQFNRSIKMDIQNVLINQLEEDFQTKEKQLTSFSRWIWRSLIAELKYRQQLGLIDGMKFTPEKFNGKKKIEALRFQKYLFYLIPWIDQMLTLQAEEFNKLTLMVSWKILHQLNQRSLLFKRYAATSSTDTKTILFNIPQRLLNFGPQELKKIHQNEGPPLSLKESAQKEKTKAQSEIQNVTIDDLSPLSDEISKELEKAQ